MKMDLGKIKNVFALGDTHGHFMAIYDIIDKLPFQSALIHVGDVGLGFNSYIREFEKLTTIDRLAKEREVSLFLCRGNHDNPSFFAADHPFSSAFENVKLVRDFTIERIGDKSFFFVGGAISIDRSGRVLGVSYWKDEGVNTRGYVKPKEKIDVWISHSAPDFCSPVGLNDLVLSWINRDSKLHKDLQEERRFLSQIYEDIKPPLCVHGHFHISTDEVIDGSRHIGLSINEVKELVL